MNRPVDRRRAAASRRAPHRARCRGCAAASRRPPWSRPRVRRWRIRRPGVSRSSIISTTLGVCTAMPSSRPAVSEVTTVESAPDCSSRCWFSASRTAAMILAFGRQLARGEGDEDGGVVAVGGDDDRFRVLGAGKAQHLGVGRTAADGDQARALGALEGRGILVDDDDVRGCDLVADHRGDRGPALGAVSDDDGVVAHFAPPSLDLQCLARLCGEGFDGGADQHDQERHPQRRDHQNVDQPGRRGDRGDVAVAGRRQRHGGVVDAVQERQRVVGVRGALDVAVAVPVQVDDQHREEQRRHRVDDPTDDPLRRADERFGDAQDVDQVGIRSRRQIRIDARRAADATYLWPRDPVIGPGWGAHAIM